MNMFLIFWVKYNFETKEYVADKPRSERVTNNDIKQIDSVSH